MFTRTPMPPDRTVLGDVQIKNLKNAGGKGRLKKFLGQEASLLALAALRIS